MDFHDSGIAPLAISISTRSTRSAMMPKIYSPISLDAFVGLIPGHSKEMRAGEQISQSNAHFRHLNIGLMQIPSVGVIRSVDGAQCAKRRRKKVSEEARV